jgi:DNA-binding XRE family transcriptional regulator
MRQRRQTHDLTQAALAEQVGCSEQMIHKLETGVARPSRQLAELLVAHLAEVEAERPALVQWARDGGGHQGHLPAPPARPPARRSPPGPTTCPARRPP